jgi:hypothetical protein
VKRCHKKWTLERQRRQEDIINMNIKVKGYEVGR